jgi:hypothetical protein
MTAPDDHDADSSKKKADIEALIERNHRNTESIARWRAKHRPGEPFPDWAEVIREMRWERTRQLMATLGIDLPEREEDDAPSNVE